MVLDLLGRVRCRGCGAKDEPSFRSSGEPGRVVWLRLVPTARTGFPPTYSAVKRPFQALRRLATIPGRPCDAAIRDRSGSNRAVRARSAKVRFRR